MRPRHWFFLVGVLLHVTGIGFVIAGARAGRDAPAVEAPVTTPVASVKQIMNGIVAPAAAMVFSSVSTISTASGVEEKQPRTPEEWDKVGDSAAALVESGNLLMIGSRTLDKGDWIKMSQALIDGGKLALKATQDKSADDLLTAGEPINESCDSCHRKYQRGS